MSGVPRLYVGNLPYDVRERDIEKFLRGYGRVRDVTLKNGFGFVELDDHRDAEDAIRDLNNRELLGQRVSVEWSRGSGPRGGGSSYGGRSGGYGGGGGGYGGYGGYDRNPRRNLRYGPPQRTENRLIVENLSSRISWQDLKDYMRSAGEVTFADAHHQREGEGVVEFASRSDMRNAMKRLDKTELSGKRIRLYEDNGGSRSRSRSRSPHRKKRSKGSRSRSPSYSSSN